MLQEQKNPTRKANKTKKKIQVYAVIPKDLKTAVDNLKLSRIMKNKAAKLVCLLIQKGIQDNNDLSSFIPLPAKYLEKVFNPFYHNDFFNMLKSEKIIECNEFYKIATDTIQGIPKGYRINQELLSGEMVSISYEDKKSRDTKFININRTFFYNPPEEHISLPSYVSSLKDIDMIFPASVSTKSDENKEIASSVVMHICTKVFDASLVIDDLSSLEYDFESIWNEMNDVIEQISHEDFQIDDGIEEDFFEVSNLINDKRYNVRREVALDWTKRHGATLIRDKRHFYIDDLDRYVTLKKRNVLFNFYWQMKKLEKKMFYVMRNEKNLRLDHNLTSMNKTMMNAIKTANGLAEIDIANSQFAIHAHWMRQEGQCRHGDVQRYYTFCSSGIFYEELQKIFGMQRSEVKQMMMELAFSSERNYTKNRSLFKQEFPNVLKHIEEFKKQNGYKQFSIELQRREAMTMIDNIYPNVKDLGTFCLTKHDSLIIRKEDRNEVLNVVNACFKFLCFECVLKIEEERIVIKNE